jgi:hypothetical protein
MKIAGSLACRQAPDRYKIRRRIVASLTLNLVVRSARRRTHRAGENRENA